MASLKTSMIVVVKSMLKGLLEGLKSTPDPLFVVNPTASELEANSGKEAAKGTQTSSPQNKNGMGTFASVPPPRSMEYRSLHRILTTLVLLLIL